MQIRAEWFLTDNYLGLLSWCSGRGPKVYEFDGVNRHNLRHFISKVVSEKPVSPPPQNPVSVGGVEFIEEYLAAALSDSAPPAEPQRMKQTVRLFLDVGEQEKIPLPRM